MRSLVDGAVLGFSIAAPGFTLLASYQRPAAALRTRCPASAMAWVNRRSALVLAAFGLLALARAAAPALPRVH